MGYVRVSTDRQATEGVSSDAQTARIRGWADAQARPVLEVYSDALSGKRAANRPGLQAALARACAERAALVVYSLSRLARSTTDAIAIAMRLDKAGADLVSLSESIDTTSAAGKMVFRLLAVLAEFERDLVAERTREALAHKRAIGERVGAIPYGWTLDADGVRLTPLDAELETLDRIHALRGEGWSPARIASALQAEGRPTKHGRPWHRSTVAKLCLRKDRRP